MAPPLARHMSAALICGLSVSPPRRLVLSLPLAQKPVYTVSSTYANPPRRVNKHPWQRRLNSVFTAQGGGVVGGAGGGGVYPIKRHFNNCNPSPQKTWRLLRRLHDLVWCKESVKEGVAWSLRCSEAQPQLFGVRCCRSCTQSSSSIWDNRSLCEGLPFPFFFFS